MPFKTYAKVPNWARFLTFDEFHLFREMVQAELETRRFLYEDNGDGKLEVADAQGAITRCNIANLALKCGAAGIGGYSGEVRQYFQRIFGETEPPPPFPESFDEVRENVRVRIYRPDQLQAGRDNCVSRPLSGQLVSVLVYNFPNFVVSVPPDHLEKWQVSPDEAFRDGVGNVPLEKVHRERFSLGQAECFSLIGEHGWAASHILHIDKYLPASASLGAIVGLPSRHILICYPIDPATVFEAMRELVPFVTGLHNDPPRGDDRQNLGTDLYWCYRGRIECIPVGSGVPGLPGTVVVPPMEFIETVLSQAIPPEDPPPPSRLS